MTTQTKDTDAQVATLEGMLQALLKAGEEAGGWTDEQTAQASAIEAAIKNLETPQPMPRKTSNMPPGWKPDGGPKTKFDPTSRKCADAFRVAQPASMGFDSLEDMGYAILTGDSQRLLSLSGQGYGIPVDGGFAVPPSFAFDMLDRALESEVVRPRARFVPMDSSEHTIASFDDSDHSSGELFGGLQGQWIGEGEGIDYEVAKLRRIKLTARKLGFLTAASNELLTDAPGFEGQFSNRMTAALSWNLDRTFLISGTGAGQPRSVLNDVALITVSKETGQSADTILWPNIVKMFARLHPTCIRNAVWVTNPKCLTELLQMNLLGGALGTTFQPALEGNANSGYSMLGRPVVLSEKMNTIGDLGDILLVDFSQYVTGILREGMRLDRSGHVKFSTDETVWRLIVRADGQGTWKTAFTPKNGDTLSWCVTLEAR